MALFLSDPDDKNTNELNVKAAPRPDRSPFVQAYRINALRVVGTIAVVFLAVTSPPPASPYVNVVLDVFGASAIFLAIGGRAWCLLYIGGRKNSKLVTRGPYSMTRNPLYFFSLVGIAGVGSISGSLLVTIMFLVSTYIAFAVAIRGEEEYLASRYGSAFTAYRRRAPRLLPNVSLWRENVDVRLHSGNAIGSLRDGIVFVLAWLAAELIDVVHATRVLPILWELPI